MTLSDPSGRGIRRQPRRGEVTNLTHGLGTPLSVSLASRVQRDRRTDRPSPWGGPRTRTRGRSRGKLKVFCPIVVWDKRPELGLPPPIWVARTQGPKTVYHPCVTVHLTVHSEASYFRKHIPKRFVECVTSFHLSYTKSSESRGPSLGSRREGVTKLEPVQ